MRLFSKTPSEFQQLQIESEIRQVQTYYKAVATTSNIKYFLDAYEQTYNSMGYLLNAEKNFPSYFRKPKPSDNIKKIEMERPEMEKQFVERYILSIEQKLLEYSTTKGKQNNFVKETDKFRYFAGEFLPETVDYFNELIGNHFPEYLQ